MKKQFALITCAFALAATSPRPTDDSPLERLAWMHGRWVIDGGGQYIEETWGPAREDAMLGSLRWSREGHVWLYELMSIEVEDGTLVFRLRHFDRSLKPWASEAEGPLTYPLREIGENEVVFENPERDSPRRFVYRREGERLTMRLEDAEGRDDTPFVFELDR